MPFRPQPRWTIVDDELCWTIDWRDQFRGGVPGKAGWEYCGEMRGFHLVFELRVHGNGTLAIWADDGCVIRRDGQVLHEDPLAHGLTRHTIDVEAGDLLEVAQWQEQGDWLWGACRSQPEASAEPLDILLPYRDAVLRRLSRPEGPPLKVFTGGEAPARAVVAVYSLILNGYVPTEVILFGEHQWSEATRSLFTAALPFARVVPTPAVHDRLFALGGWPIVELAQDHWSVMKACVSLLWPPTAFCAMDDDVLVLDRVDDARRAFRKHDLVFAADADFGSDYLEAWGLVLDRSEALPTGTFNAGLYWLRNHHDPRAIVAALVRLREIQPETHPQVWEQGLIAVLFADVPARQLPTARYFYPVWDGMPGGFLEYDYARNPCGFASVHFGGVHPKPGDRAALALATDVLGRICPPAVSTASNP
jgi:hypothetical protein